MKIKSISEAHETQALKAKSIVLNVTGVDVDATARLRHIVEARMMYAKLLRELGLSYASIGYTISKDHTTVMHYINVLNSLLETDGNILLLYKKCEYELIKSSEEFFLSRVKTEEDTELVKVLRGKIERLTLEKKRLEYFQSFERLREIIEVVNERTPKGKEEEVRNKIIRMFNGI